MIQSPPADPLTEFAQVFADLRARPLNDALLTRADALLAELVAERDRTAPLVEAARAYAEAFAPLAELREARLAATAACYDHRNVVVGTREQFAAMREADDAEADQQGRAAQASNQLRAAALGLPARADFQTRAVAWVRAAFGTEPQDCPQERAWRFFEEAAELAQACGVTQQHAMQLVAYTYARPPGEVAQEIGGVALTLAPLAASRGVNLTHAAEAELARVNTPEKIALIRAKDASAPADSPLPGGQSHERLLPGENGESGVYADDDREGGYLRVHLDDQGDVYFTVSPEPRSLTAPTVRMVAHCVRRPQVLAAARALAATLAQEPA